MFEKNKESKQGKVNYAGKRYVFKSFLNWSVEFAALIIEGIWFHSLDTVAVNVQSPALLLTILVFRTAVECSNIEAV